MKSLREIAGTRRFAVLGGRTLAENHEWWLDRCRRDANVLPFPGANHVPPESKPDEVPEPSEDIRAAQALRQHVSRLNIPPRVADILLAGPKSTESVQAVHRWFVGGKSFLLLHGVSGTGKTVAASSAFLHMRRRVEWHGGSQEQWDSGACAFETSDGLARLGYFSDEADETLKYLGRVKLLVLDDLGAEMASESWRATLDSLLSERFGRPHCRTILTTNLSARRPDGAKASPFEDRYGVRVARRIRESGVVHGAADPP